MFALPNQQTVPQIVKSAQDAGLAVGAAVTTAVVNKASDAAAKAVTDTVKALPLPHVVDDVTSVAVAAISDNARKAVEDLLNKYKVVA